MTRSGTYPCSNPDCGKILEDAESATLWMNSDLGLTTLRSCRNQECAKKAVLAAEAMGWKLRKGNLPPMKPEEREAYLAKRASRDS